MMKRHIYLRMKSVPEAREIFLSRFDLNNFLPPKKSRRWPPGAG